MSFIESLLTCYKKFFNYRDRASKSEFWWFTLYFIIISQLGGLYGHYLYERYDTSINTSLGLFNISLAIFFIIPLFIINKIKVIDSIQFS